MQLEEHGIGAIQQVQQSTSVLGNNTAAPTTPPAGGAGKWVTTISPQKQRTVLTVKKLTTVPHVMWAPPSHLGF